MVAQLYCFGESGNAYKCALALSLTGMDWEPVFVDFFHGETRGDTFRKINPMGEVPVLREGDLTLTQSGLILTHIAEKAGWLGGQTEEARRQVLRWLFWDGHKFSSQIGNARFLSNFLAPEKRPEGVIPFLMARLKPAYRLLNDQLSTSDWIAGADPTIADLALCSYLYYPEPFGFSRTDWPHIDRWLDRIAGLPGWKHPYDMMPGNPSDRA